MPSLDELTDGRGFVLCRYCTFAHPPGRDSSAPWTCTIGDHPPPGDPVDPDICECVYGELVSESEQWERQNR